MNKAQAPAKIHLIGEYSAVYSKPAILFPINLHLEVSINKTSKVIKKEPFQKAIEQEITTRFKKKIPNYSMEIKSNIPVGSGLGSSSALSASLTLAILKMLNIKATSGEIFKAALAGETVFHGFPSGSDLITVIAGKIIWYRKENADLILYKSININLPDDLELYLINTGIPKETTKQMVDFVMKKVPKNKFKQMADDQERLTKETYSILNNFESKKFLQTIIKAQRNLEKLEVVSKKTKLMISKIEAIGAAAKITGAGGKKDGSGMLIAYHKNSQKLLTLASKNNWEITKIELAKGGLR